MTFTDLYWQSNDGLRLHARDYPPRHPKGRLPVICLHGLTRNARDFEDLAPSIADHDRRVIAVDFRGRGMSSYSPDPMSYWPPVYAQDILALMIAQEIPRALFIGTSLGGIVTMLLAGMAPERAAGAVLNDVGPKLSPTGLARIASYVSVCDPVRDWAEAAAFARARNGAAFPALTEGQWDAFARRLFVDAPDGTLKLDYDPAIAEPFRQAAQVSKAPDAPPPPDLQPMFLNLTKDRPTLLIRGAISDLLDGPLSDAMRASAPAMSYAEVPGVGHAPLLTEPDAWAAIKAWLAKAP
jgi:pimeloyl-ACP methyl ester carboxylesterase